MNMQAIDLLLVFNTAAIIPAPPDELENWVDNNGNFIVDNLGNFIVFNVPT